MQRRAAPGRRPLPPLLPRPPPHARRGRSSPPAQEFILTLQSSWRIRQRLFYNQGNSTPKITLDTRQPGTAASIVTAKRRLPTLPGGVPQTRSDATTKNKKIKQNRDKRAPRNTDKSPATNQNKKKENHLQKETQPQGQNSQESADTRVVSPIFLCRNVSGVKDCVILLQAYTSITVLDAWTPGKADNPLSFNALQLQQQLSAPPQTSPGTRPATLDLVPQITGYPQPPLIINPESIILKPPCLLKLNPVIVIPVSPHAKQQDHLVSAAEGRDSQPKQDKLLCSNRDENISVKDLGKETGLQRETQAEGQKSPVVSEGRAAHSNTTNSVGSIAKKVLEVYVTSATAMSQIPDPPATTSATPAAASAAPVPSLEQQTHLPKQVGTRRMNEYKTILPKPNSGTCNLSPIGTMSVVPGEDLQNENITAVKSKGKSCNTKRPSSTKNRTSERQIQISGSSSEGKVLEVDVTRATAMPQIPDPLATTSATPAVASAATMPPLEQQAHHTKQVGTRQINEDKMEPPQPNSGTCNLCPLGNPSVVPGEVEQNQNIAAVNSKGNRNSCNTMPTESTENSTSERQQRQKTGDLYRGNISGSANEAKLLEDGIAQRLSVLQRLGSFVRRRAQATTLRVATNTPASPKPSTSTTNQSRTETQPIAKTESEQQSRNKRPLENTNKGIGARKRQKKPDEPQQGTQVQNQNSTASVRTQPVNYICDGLSGGKKLSGIPPQWGTSPSSYAALRPLPSRRATQAACAARPPVHDGQITDDHQSTLVSNRTTLQIQQTAKTEKEEQCQNKRRRENTNKGTGARKRQKESDGPQQGTQFQGQNCIASAETSAVNDVCDGLSGGKMVTADVVLGCAKPQQWRSSPPPLLPMTTSPTPQSVLASIPVLHPQTTISSPSTLMSVQATLPRQQTFSPQGDVGMRHSDTLASNFTSKGSATTFVQQLQESGSFTPPKQVEHQNHQENFLHDSTNQTADMNTQQEDEPQSSNAVNTIAPSEECNGPRGGKVVAAGIDLGSAVQPSLPPQLLEPSCALPIPLLTTLLPPTTPAIQAPVSVSMPLLLPQATFSPQATPINDEGLVPLQLRCSSQMKQDKKYLDTEPWNITPNRSASLVNYETQKTENVFAVKTRSNPQNLNEWQRHSMDQSITSNNQQEPATPGEGQNGFAASEVVVAGCALEAGKSQAGASRAGQAPPQTNAPAVEPSRQPPDTIPPLPQLSVDDELIQILSGADQLVDESLSIDSIIESCHSPNAEATVLEELKDSLNKVNGNTDKEANINADFQLGSSDEIIMKNFGNTAGTHSRFTEFGSCHSEAETTMDNHESNFRLLEILDKDTCEYYCGLSFPSPDEEVPVDLWKEAINCLMEEAANETNYEQRQESQHLTTTETARPPCTVQFSKSTPLDSFEASASTQFSTARIGALLKENMRQESSTHAGGQCYQQWQKTQNYTNAVLSQTTQLLQPYPAVYGVNIQHNRAIHLDPITAENAFNTVFHHMQDNKVISFSTSKDVTGSECQSRGLQPTGGEQQEPSNLTQQQWGSSHHVSTAAPVFSHLVSHTIGAATSTYPPLSIDCGNWTAQYANVPASMKQAEASMSADCKKSVVQQDREQSSVNRAPEDKHVFLHIPSPYSYWPSPSSQDAGQSVNLEQFAEIHAFKKPEAGNLTAVSGPGGEAASACIEAPTNPDNEEETQVEDNDGPFSSLDY